eukprot:1392611-Amorphochlora_amoeboformis.AAC.1
MRRRERARRKKRIRHGDERDRDTTKSKRRRQSMNKRENMQRTHRHREEEIDFEAYIRTRIYTKMYIRVYVTCYPKDKTIHSQKREEVPRKRELKKEASLLNNRKEQHDKKERERNKGQESRLVKTRGEGSRGVGKESKVNGVIYVRIHRICSYLLGNRATCVFRAPR